MTKRKIEYWVIPPEQDAECLACMEEVLETYAQAYDPTYPVLCMDEQPVQLLKETRVPIAATTKHGTHIPHPLGWRSTYFSSGMFRTASQLQPCYGSSHARRYVTHLCLRSVLWGSCYRLSKPTKFNICPL